MILLLAFALYRVPCVGAVASLRNARDVMGQLMADGSEASHEAAPSDTSSPASLQLQAAFVSSIASIAADAVLVRPVPDAASMAQYESPGLLMTMLLSAGGMLHARQRRLRVDIAGDEGHSAKPTQSAASQVSGPDDGAEAALEAAVQGCLQVDAAGIMPDMKATVYHAAKHQEPFLSK